MKTLLSRQFVGVLALLCSSVGTAATLTVVPSTLSPAVDDIFTVTLNAADIVNIGGITLSMTWDITKVNYVSGTLPATGPVGTGTGTFLVVTGPAGALILDILPGAPPVAGDFPVAVLTFQALAAGTMNLLVNDDGGIFTGWFDNDTAEPIPVSYTQANVTVSEGPVTVTTLISGRMGVTQETCLQRLTVLVGEQENCMYDGGPSSIAAATPTGEVTGPYNHIAYYDSLATPAAFTATTATEAPFARSLYVPTAGDGKIEQVISGSVSIDDNGNGFGSDDLIAFTVTLASPGSGAIVRSYGASVVDKYDSMTQVLAPVAASSATANGSGGFDYIVGSEGFPALLTYSQAGDCLGAAFGSVECAHSFNTGVDPDYWTGTSLAGLGSLESNLGAKTTGTVVNLACIDSAPVGVESNDCRDSQVSLNPWVNGPCAVAGGCTLNEGAVGAVRGAAEDVGWDQLLFKVSTDASGNVIAVAGFNVDDYRVFDETRCGDNNDLAATGSYSANCNSWTSGYFTAGAGEALAVNDTASTTRNAGISIPVGTNDTGFDSTVTATAGSCDAGGTFVIVGSGGPTSGISANYTPASAAGSPGYTEICAYTLADGLHPADSATVTVTVSNTVPDAVAGNLSAISTQGLAPAGRTGTFTAPGGGSLGNTPAVVTVTAQGAEGNAVVAGNLITYTVTNAAFFTGADSFTYTVTDADGETDSAVVTVTIADVAPVIADAAITTDMDEASAATALTITAGNGSLAQHTLAVTTNGADGSCTLTAPNGTGQVIYTPDPGFLGTDSCVLTLTDGDGDPDTATVSITVNESGTIVIDGGSSAVDPWSLAFLGGLPFLRRRRKAVAMKLAMAAAAGVLAAPAAMAVDEWDWDYDGFYLGTGAIGTSLETSDEFNSAIASSGNFEDFPIGGQFYAGWMFNNIFGIEGRWSDSGDGESDILFVDGGGSATDIGDIEVSLDGWTVYGVANWPIAERWDLFGKAGYTGQDIDVDITMVDESPYSATDDDSGFAAALGARWRFARHWAATVEGEYLGVDIEVDDGDGGVVDAIDEPWRVGLNVEYWFGGHEIPPPPPPPPPARVAATPPPPPPPAPKDSDGDGVVDPSDQCPDTPRGDRVGAQGCSCDVTRQLTFKTDSAELSDADKAVLDEMAANLLKLKFIEGVIEGHTDSTGAEAYNQGLSERRAESAAAYLESRGIARDRLKIVGRGESEPIGDNATAEGRAQNRRVVAKRTDCDQ